MEDCIFNLNNYIKVQLTDMGYEHWKQYNDSVFGRLPQLHQYIRSLEDYKAHTAPQMERPNCNPLI